MADNYATIVICSDKLVILLTYFPPVDAIKWLFLNRSLPMFVHDLLKFDKFENNLLSIRFQDV